MTPRKVQLLHHLADRPLHVAAYECGCLKADVDLSMHLSYMDRARSWTVAQSMGSSACSKPMPVLCRKLSTWDQTEDQQLRQVMQHVSIDCASPAHLEQDEALLQQAAITHFGRHQVRLVAIRLADHTVHLLHEYTVQS